MSPFLTSGCLVFKVQIECFSVSTAFDCPISQPENIRAITTEIRKTSLIGYEPPGRHRYTLIICIWALTMVPSKLKTEQILLSKENRGG